MSFVTGIGGVFFKSRNPSDLARWYRDVLGVPADADSASWAFPWQDQHGEPEHKKQEREAERQPHVLLAQGWAARAEGIAGKQQLYENWYGYQAKQAHSYEQRTTAT